MSWGTEGDGAAVGDGVVGAIGDADSNCVGAEVMIVDRPRCAIPAGTLVFEITDEFAFLVSTLMIGRRLRWKRSRRSAMRSKVAAPNLLQSALEGLPSPGFSHWDSRISGRAMLTISDRLWMLYT